MNNYMYFINLDDNIVKFGISNRISTCINSHYSKFVTQKQICNQLKIIKLICINHDILNKKTESRLKKYIKFNNVLFKEYEETELFYITDLDFYIKKIETFIKHIIAEFDSNDNSYYELNDAEISLLYTKSVKKEKIVTLVNGCDDTNNTYYEKICPRCGKQFNQKSSLNLHFKKKNICEAKYMDVSYDELLKNFDLYYNDYFMQFKFKKIDNTNDDKTCLRCGHNFVRTDSFKRHLKRKNLCELNYLDIDYDFMVKNYESLKNVYTSMANFPHQQLIKKVIKSDITVDHCGINSDQQIVEKSIEKTDKAYICNFCGKEYTNKNSFYVHKKRYCKKAKIENEKISLTQDILNNKYEVMKIEYEEKIEKQSEEINKIKSEMESKANQEKNKLKDELYEKINELEKKLQILTVNSAQNIGHQGDIEQQTNIENQQNNQINIYINAYGSEDISHLTLQDWSQILNKNFGALPELVKRIHIDKRENCNLYIPDMKNKYGMRFNGEYWEFKELKPMLDELVLDNIGRMYEFINKPSIKIERELYDKIDEIVDKTEKEEKTREMYKEKLKLLLLSNRDKIKETYENIYNKKLKI